MKEERCLSEDFDMLIINYYEMKQYDVRYITNSRPDSLNAHLSNACAAWNAYAEEHYT